VPFAYWFLTYAIKFLDIFAGAGGFFGVGCKILISPSTFRHLTKRIKSQTEVNNAKPALYYFPCIKSGSKLTFRGG
jgi:hypothetical protein